MRVERERIEIPVAEGRVVEHNGRKVGVVRLAGFSAGAHGFVREQVDRLLKKRVDGIVLDLRGNGGGLLSEAVLVSSIFIEDGRIVSVRGRSRPNRTEDAVGDAIPGRRARWWCSWTGAAPAPPRSSPERCATAGARRWWARAPTARASCRR